MLAPRFPAALAAALLVAASAASAMPITIDIAGPDGTGFLSLSNVKNWATQPDPVTQSPYPYFFDSGTNVWRSIAASPLSAGSTYAEESSFAVLNKSVTQFDFATIRAGTLTYDNAGLAGVGVENIGVGGITMNLNTLDYASGQPGVTFKPGTTAGFISPFSPIHTPYNTGSGFGNFGWSYVITPSNLTGTGLTFTDGALTSIDFAADIAVQVRLANSPNSFFAFGRLYNGTVAFSGNRYEFDLDVTQTVSSPLGTLNDTRMVFNREGAIAAVVPEPSTYALMAAGLLALGAMGLRRRTCT